jgi:hypothetical protein
MSRAQLPPETDRELSTLKGRVSDLERILRRIEQAYKPEAMFSYSGVLAVASSGRWYSRTGGRLGSILFSLNTPGETDTVLELYKNGALLSPVTIPAGVDRVTIPFENVKFFPDADYLTLRISSAGAGAADLGAQGQMI